MTDINSLNTQELVYNINHQKAEIARYKSVIKRLEKDVEDMQNDVDITERMLEDKNKDISDLIFKVAGKLQKCTAVKALGGMMAKHTVSVYDLIDDYDTGVSISKAMWREKIGDSINYLLLLTALLEEDLKDDN